MAVPSHIVEEIKYRNNIEEVISQYVTLKRAGSNTVGLCPFHSEKTPSFTVFGESRNFYCFGCGAGGDVITFVMKMENLEYPEALEYLAKRAGIEIPRTQEEQKEGVKRSRILDMNRTAARFFREQLKASPEALEYCAKRSLSAATINHFGIGYAPQGFGALTDHMHAQGYTDEELTAGFLCGTSRKTGRSFDYFRGRLIFPIIDAAGDVIAFGGRVLDDSLPKYLNTSDTPAFKKSRNLYAFNFAKKACRESLILCEGYMDVVSLHAAGVTNAVATLGTALTPEQARIMKRYTDRVIISYDSDEAGQKAANRAFSILREAGAEARVLKLDGAKDPDEFIRRFGVERFRMTLEGSVTEFDYRFANILEKYDTASTDGKIRAANELTALISGFKSSVERDIYTGRAADRLGISAESLKRDVEKNVSRNVRAQKKKDTEELKRRSEGFGDRVNPDYVKNVKASAAEEAILGIMTACPEYIKLVQKGKISLSADDFVSEFARRVFTAITGDGEFDSGCLNEVFGAAEVARITGMQIARRGLANTEEALTDSIQVLKSAKAREDMSLEEILKMKRKQNQGG